MSSYKRTTQTPNIIFDHLLKEVTETELKVLLTIIRKTMGQADLYYPTKRIQRAWISQRLFCICTGKSGRAVSSAIDTLSRKRYIHITDEDENVLDTKSKRRGASRLYYATSFVKQEPAPATYELRCNSAMKKGHTIKLNEIKESCYNSSQCTKRLSDTERYQEIQQSLSTKYLKATRTSTNYSPGLERERKNM